MNHFDNNQKTKKIKIKGQNGHESVRITIFIIRTKRLNGKNQINI